MMKDNAKAILDYVETNGSNTIPDELIVAMKTTQEEISTKPSVDKLMNFRYQVGKKDE